MVGKVAAQRRRSAGWRGGCAAPQFGLHAVQVHLLNVLRELTGTAPVHAQGNVQSLHLVGSGDPDPQVPVLVGLEALIEDPYPVEHLTTD
jgi:hypothetical protein